MDAFTIVRILLVKGVFCVFQLESNFLHYGMGYFQTDRLAFFALRSLVIDEECVGFELLYDSFADILNIRGALLVN